MLRSLLVPVVLATLVAALTSSQVLAYGAVHRGYTAVTPTGGVQHYGTTTTNRGYGDYSHTATTTAGGGTATRTGTTTGPDGRSVTRTGTATDAGGTVTRTGTATGTGAYGGTYHETNARVYSPTGYQGYSAAGRTTDVSTTGVYRYR